MGNCTAGQLGPKTYAAEALLSAQLGSQRCMIRAERSDGRGSAFMQEDRDPVRDP